VLRLSPDAVIVETDSPSRDTLENLCMITESCPRPIVMFANDPARESIREAVRVGVNAYVVDGLSPERIAPIIETAWRGSRRSRRSRTSSRKPGPSSASAS
jgi:response regulator NasT